MQVFNNYSKTFTIKCRNRLLKRNKSTTTAEYCLESVKRYDYDNFICTLLLKNSTRASAFAVRGFNIEVARVGQQVSDSKIGEVRLQFWEDAINNCFSQDISRIPQHPVVAEVYKALLKTKFTKRYFNTLISSRRERLNENTFTSIEHIEKYSEKSISNVYYLILESSGMKNVKADHAASHLGKAQGLVQQLRNISIAKSINIIPLPQDILAKNKVSQEEILRGICSERLNECTFEVASRAHQHLMKSRSILKNVPKEARNIFLPAVSVENYLLLLQKLDYNVLHPQLRERKWNWLPKLWFKYLQNKY